MPVGPQLPPHFAKRKRSIDDAETPTSPPRKVQAASGPRILGPSAPPPTNNPDELDMNDSSEDDYGPSLKPTKAATKASGPTKPTRTVGPSLPPPKNPDELDMNDSSEDDYGPSAPQAQAKSKPTNPPPPPKRILGPAPPPANLAQRPSHPANPTTNDSSDSEDDYGPSLPPAPGSYAESQMLQQRAAAELQASETLSTAAPKRDDWMLVPPSDSDWGSRVDPTKLKNRKFQSGKGSKAPIDKSGGISALWTETPEQKRQRLEDEVLGRKDKMLNSSGPREREGKEDKGEVETARRIQEYNDKNRSKSLWEAHQGVTTKEKEDDPSQRGFDREKDMALGGRLGHGEKREMLAKAKDFGSRFQKGKYL